ncbi:MAG: hypothetical protein IH830_04015 [Planctomycetes bacterium]|nr:hypothetical protein [Planctomycetota bacterium]
MWKLIVGFSIAVSAAGSAAGAIVPIGPFDGDKAEGFETQPPFQFERSYDVFGGQGVVQQLGAGQGLHITTGWSFFGLVFPHSGTYFMGGAGVNAAWMFDFPALRFGGYFTTNADVADAVAEFFDADNNSLGILPVTAPLNGAWTWNGWETDGAGIKRIEIVSNNIFNGFIMHDDMQYTPIPAPGVLALVGLAGLIARRRRR